MGKIYQIKVYGIEGEMFIIDLCNTEEEMKRVTVLQLKEKIIEKCPYLQDLVRVKTIVVGGVTQTYEPLQLIFTNKRLDKDSALLSEYGIQHLSVIQVVTKEPGGYNPRTGDDGMGDKEGKNRSMERLSSF